jgi:cytochrome c
MGEVMKGFALDRNHLFVGAAIVMLCLAFSYTPGVTHAADVQAGNADQGKIVFEKRCTGCHSLDQDKEGPHLRGVFGRKAGKITGFPYSDGMKSAQFTWDAAALDKWLTDTESVVPDNDMSFHVPSAQERADIIQFLEAMSGK